MLQHLSYAAQKQTQQNKQTKKMTKVNIPSHPDTAGQRPWQLSTLACTSFEQKQIKVINLEISFKNMWLLVAVFIMTNK